MTFFAVHTAILGCALSPAGRNINYNMFQLTHVPKPTGRLYLHEGTSSKPQHRDIGLETDEYADHGQSTAGA